MIVVALLLPAPASALALIGVDDKIGDGMAYGAEKCLLLESRTPPPPPPPDC